MADKIVAWILAGAAAITGIGLVLFAVWLVVFALTDATCIRVGWHSAYVAVTLERYCYYGPNTIRPTPLRDVRPIP